MKRRNRNRDDGASETAGQTVAGSVAEGRDSAAAGVGMWSRRVIGGLLAVFLLAGAGAGLVAVTGPAAAQKTDVGALQDAQVRQEQAGGYAADFVGAWLSATEQNPDRLLGYLDESGVDISIENTVPVLYKDLAVVSTEQISGSRVLVTVSAAVAAEQPAPQQASTGQDEGKEDDEPKPESAASAAPAAEQSRAWTRQHYQVTVVRDGSGMAVAGLPTPVAAPEAATAGAGVYAHEVVTDAIRTEVQEMLAAYAAGQGDLARYTVPGVNLAPISPTPFESVSLVSLQAIAPVDGEAAAGTRLNLAATVELSGSGLAQPATYYLTLAYESGTWQMADLSATPVMETNTSSNDPGKRK
ncbi:conjugal transfer protein [Arthrobacter castelli]|uniref:conjugal transfer protein n=1 Tax=Arthrobacter castelli TaxID=271431 RepID=UPI00041B66EC|nr:conjugal transfer protein [Arthrobacter castelli]